MARLFGVCSGHLTVSAFYFFALVLSLLVLNFASSLLVCFVHFSLLVTFVFLLVVGESIRLVRLTTLKFGMLSVHYVNPGSIVVVLLADGAELFFVGPGPAPSGPRALPREMPC